MAASRESFTDIIQILLAARADVNQTKTDSPDTALTVAAEFGLCPVAHELCKARADVNKATAETGATAMLIAAEHGYSTVVDLLGSFKADPNKALTTPDGLTSVAVAAKKGSVEVMKFLQVHRADLNQPCSERMLTPLMLAAEHGHTKLVQRCLVMICDDSSSAPKHPSGKHGLAMKLIMSYHVRSFHSGVPSYI